MQASEPAMKKMMDRAFAKADISAEQVAMSIYQQVQKGHFLILTHPEGKKAFLMKKLMPSGMYIKSMLKRTLSMQRLLDNKSS